MFSKIGYSIVCFLFASGLVAQTIESEFIFATNFETRPTFMEGNNPYFVNSGKWLYIGKTADFDEPGVYFYDTSSKERIYKAIPLEAYYLTHTTDFLGQIETKGKRLPLTVYEFLFYEEGNHRAGFVVENKGKASKAKKYFYVGWDLNSNAIDVVEPIYEIPEDDKKSFAQSSYIGYSEKDQAAYFTFAVDADLKDNESEDVTAFIYKIQNQNLTKLKEYQSKFYPYTPEFHPESNQIVIAAYAEAFQNRNPLGYLFQLDTNTFSPFSIPSTPYGICFSKDGKTLYMAAADTGEVRIYITNNLNDVKKTKWGTHGHKLGFWKDSELVWVRNSGLHIYDPKTLKQKKVIPTKKFYKNHVNVSGSVFLPFQKLMLRNILEDPKGGASNRILIAE
ncbi:YncE family protein [Leptospira sp. WS39.C2]